MADTELTKDTPYRGERQGVYGESSGESNAASRVQAL